MDPLPGLLHLSNWASILKSSFLFSINPFSIFFNFRDKNTRSVAAATAKSLQSCPTLCDPIDGSLPGSAVLGILQARTLEWVAISFSNAWKWKVKWSRSVVSNPQQPHGLQPSRLLCPWDFPGKSTGVGCHCLLRDKMATSLNFPSSSPLNTMKYPGRKPTGNHKGLWRLEKR